MAALHAASPQSELLESRQLLSAATEAVAWDLQTPAVGDLAVDGELDYFRFHANAGDKYAFTSTGQKNFTILAADGTTRLDNLLIYDGILHPTPGRLLWTAPATGDYFIEVSGYTAFLIHVPTGEYALTAHQVTDTPAGAPVIEFDEPLTGDLTSPGDIDYFTFEATADTVYRFEVLSETVPAHMLQIIEAPIRRSAPAQPMTPAEAFAGDNLIATNMDGQLGLSLSMDFLAKTSGTYHISIAPLAAANIGPYTLRMSHGPVLCDPIGDRTSSLTLSAASAESTSRNTQPKKSSLPARRQKSSLHHRRPSQHKRDLRSSKDHSPRAKRKSPSSAKAPQPHKPDAPRLFGSFVSANS
jgi:hypothetical protein